MDPRITEFLNRIIPILQFWIEGADPEALKGMVNDLVNWLIEAKP